MERSRESLETFSLYLYNVNDDPKTLDEVMKSKDVALWKEGMRDEKDSIIGNNTWLLTNHQLGCDYVCCKCIFQEGNESLWLC